MELSFVFLSSKFQALNAEAQRSKVISSVIKILALVEADVVTGAAKSLLDFERAAQEFGTIEKDLPRIETSVVTYVRDGIETGAENVSFDQNATAPNEFVAAARAFGMTVDVIKEHGRFDRNVIRALRAVVARRQPDIIVSYHVKSHFLVKLSGLWRTHKWVAFHHGYTTTDAKMRAYNLLDRWSLPKAHKVLTVCEAFARELEQTKGVRRERLHVEHNSIRFERALDKAAGGVLKAKHDIAPDEKVIIAIGRFSREKGHAQLFDAFALLLKNQPQLKVKLLLAGDGAERARLAAQAETLGIQDKIIFAGQVSDVLPFYAAADVMALPSHSEGSPFALLEAMAAGVPVVATAVGGVPEMVKDQESALLVPAMQSQALANALARVLTEAELAENLKHSAQKLIATRFAPQTYYHRLASFYADVLQS